MSINKQLVEIAQRTDLTPEQQAEEAGMKLSTWNRARHGMIALGMIEARRGRSSAVLEDGGTAATTVAAAKNGMAGRVPGSVLRAIGAEVGSQLTYTLKGGKVTLGLEAGEAKPARKRKKKAA